MSNSLYKVVPGVLNAPLATDINQLIDVLNGLFDVGAITLAPPITTPSTGGITATAVAGAGLSIGAYIYKFTYVVGYKKSDNSLIYGNETNGSASVNVTTTSGNQKVNLAGLPTSWPTNVIALRIYRTAVGGVDNTQKLVATLTSPIATYADTIADGSLGAAAPTVNTTGTYLQLPNLGSLPIVAASGTICIVNYQWYISNGSTWSQMTPLAATPSVLGTVEIAATPAAGSPIVSTRVGNVMESLLAATTITNVLSYTPLIAGNFSIHISARVVTAATNITVEVDYNDAAGAQVNAVFPIASVAIGTHQIGIPLFINAVAGTAILVRVTAGTANQAYISSSIVGV